MRTLRYRLAVAVVGSLTAITTLVALPAPPATAQAADPVPARVSAQTGVRVVPNSDASLGNADLIGNGDVLVSTYGNPDALSFNVSKNDLYKDMSQQSSGAKDPAAPLRAGSVVVRIPALTGATYRQEQDPYRAEIRTVLAAGSTSVVERSRVLATSANVLATDVANTSGTPVSVTVDTVANQAFLTSGATTTAGTANGTTAWVSSTGPNGLGFGPANNPFRMRASMSTRVFGATATVSTGTAGTASSAFTIPPGATATVVTQIASTGGDVLTNTPADPLPTSNDGVDALSAQSVADLSTAHLGWWDTFWHRSSVQLDAEPTLMRYYYGALYMLASSNRAGAFAPGLNGWNGTDRPQYNGDYTTNYNVQAPYYGVYSSNHPELAQPYYTAILSINAEQGKALASSRGFQGTYFYTHYGPHGIQSDKAFGDGSQRTNALESTINFLNDYAYTRDTATLRAGYPFLRDVADFWDAYLVKDASGRYVVNDSTVAELDGAHKFNPTTALAFLRTFYSGILGAGQDLGLDAGRRAKWQDILANLATYTTVTSGGKQVFSFSEDNPSATANPYPYNLYPVFPAGQVGMNGPLAAVARNTISTRDYWTQGNSFNQIYPAAVRAGYPAPRVASTMTATLARMGPDNIIKQPGGGIETAGGIEAVNSMLLQSTENVLRVFPNWTGTDASFTDLRAVGAFTVSSGLAGGVVQDVRITSEKGQPLTVQNPWPGKALVVTASGGGAVPTTRSAGNYALATTAGTVYTLSPAGGLPVADATDLALHRPVTATSSLEQNGWSAAALVDGDPASAPGSLGYTSTGTQNANHSEAVTVDLGADQFVSRVDLAPRNDAGNVGSGFPVDYTVSTSADGTNWTTVATKTGVAPPGDALQTVTFAPTDAQYVRVTATTLRPNPTDGGKYRLQLAEMKVFGSISTARPVSHSSDLESGGWGRATVVDAMPRSVDGNLGWTSTGNLGVNHPEWVGVDLGSAQPVSSVVLAPRTDAGQAGNGFPVDMTVSVSTDGSTWTPVRALTGLVQPTAPQTYTFATATARYVRVTGTSLRANPNDQGQYRMQLSELGVFP